MVESQYCPRFVLRQMYRKTWFYTTKLYFGKACAETLNFSLSNKLDLRKTKLFPDRSSSFCSRYPSICDITKKMDYSLGFLKILFWLPVPGSQCVRSSPRVSLVLVWVSNLHQVLLSRGFWIRVSITLV
jgi:hypothetical protein